jgi:muramoyltetrapeptide carboxypeptidase
MMSEKLVNASASLDLIKPKTLKQGDTVGLITPATYVPDPDRLASARRMLNYFGLKLKMGKYAGKRMGDYTLSINERVDDLHEMFRDTEVKAIICVRGGYGSMHLLDKIDYDLIRRNPKIFVGYSDITAMHLAITRHSRLTTFHGPMTLATFTEYSRENFRKALFETKPLGKLSNPPEKNEMRPSHPTRAIRSGRATGPLVGGNLTLITATLGTQYEIDTKGKILFLEDIDEEPYDIDRMLTQMRLAGKLQEAAGIVFGECADCRPKDYKPSLGLPYSLGEVLDNILGQLKVPVFYGLTLGHTDDQLTLPLGVLTTLDADAGTIEITESATT